MRLNNGAINRHLRSSAYFEIFPHSRHFKVLDNDKTSAVCCYCGTKLSQGGSPAKTFTTSALFGHLKAKRPEQHVEYEKETAAGAKKKASGVSGTPSASDGFEKMKKTVRNRSFV